MTGKHIIGVMADFKRKSEGEYICPVCTIFGLEDEEVQILIDSGLRMTDHNIDDEGYEVEISAFKLMRELGKLLGFEPLPSQTVCTDAPGGRKTLIWTLFKDIEK